MSVTVPTVLAGVRRRCVHLELVVAGLALALTASVQGWWARIRASGDRGSESVEKAVLVAIGLAVAIGLTVAIRAVVQKYQNQLH